MDTRELAKIDLNLLISLQVLLEERSVSRAAERLFITQPAMSKTLSRLRVLFEDPLFTRSSHGMQPTPRASELADDLARILADVSELVSVVDFEPGAFEGEVNLALSEYMGVALLPPLVQKLRSQAPHLNLRVITRVEKQLEELAQGNLDLAVHIEHENYPPEFCVEHLGGSPPALLVRDGHPLTQGKATWQRLSEFPLIRLYVSDWEQVAMRLSSDAYESLTRHAQGSLELSHLLTALEVLRGSDYFMPGPAYLLQHAEAARGIRAVPVPQGAEKSIDYVLVRHKRTANSGLHNWLWQEITCTIRELRAPVARKMRQRLTAGSDRSPR